MRKLLTLLLTLTLLTTLLPVRAETAQLSLAPVGETVRPGKAVSIAFDAPTAGAADIQVLDDQGQTVSIVALGYAAAAGHNELLWNGTYEGVPAPEGSYALTVRLGGETDAVTISIGAYAPYLAAITPSAEQFAIGETFTVTYASSIRYGDVTWGVWVGDQWKQLGVQKCGVGSVTWDGTVDGAALPAGTYSFTLMLTDVTDFDSTQEHVNVTLTAEPVQTAEPAAEAAVAADVPAAETAEPIPEVTEEVTEEVLLEDEPAPDTLTDTPAEAAVDQRSFTPAYGSPYTDTSANYWTTPMDITDEAAVWEMLTAPITVIDGNEKTQITLRKEPDEDSQGVGVITCGTQGVHVLERGDEWSLVECYSSSFHDNTVKTWNMLVQGYVKTSKLLEKKPTTKLGIVIDKLTQRLYLFQDGKLLSTLLVSTGLANERQPYNETRSGEFLLTSAVGEFASDNLYCSMAIRFNDGDLLHEVPHTKNADGSKNYRNAEAKLGTRASHGCIRVQRKRTPEGINMQWLWNNRVKNTRLFIWEDWQGRQIPVPDDSMVLYYNPDGGTSYHSAETCNSTKAGVVFTAFTYDQLETEPFASLTRCDYCAPALRAAEIEAINETHAPGGDHDPVLTAAREKVLAEMAAAE